MWFRRDRCNGRWRQRRRVIVGCDDEAGEFGGDVNQFGEGLLADGDDVVFALGGFLSAEDPTHCRCEVVVGIGESVSGEGFGHGSGVVGHDTAPVVLSVGSVTCSG